MADVEPKLVPLGMVFVSGLTFLGGFVLLLIGRDYDSTINEISSS
ncbi:hypothetical protein [Mesorhizobium cantuariense]|uniref:Uncharacterized protein n=1 Tax=Mesorhizobium cantuariense TaxID=1300275 RepID=A0ABV7MN50_9HYPH